MTHRPGPGPDDRIDADVLTRLFTELEDGEAVTMVPNDKGVPVMNVVEIDGAPSAQDQGFTPEQIEEGVRRLLEATKPPPVPPLGPNHLRRLLDGPHDTPAAKAPAQADNVPMTLDEVNAALIAACPSFQVIEVPPILALKPQEIPFDHPESCCRFDPTRKRVVATRNALTKFDQDEIVACLEFLREKAIAKHGLDRLQVFEDDAGRKLWIIEDGECITALLPEDY